VQTGNRQQKFAPDASLQMTGGDLNPPALLFSARKPATDAESPAELLPHGKTLSLRVLSNVGNRVVTVKGNLRSLARHFVPISARGYQCFVGLLENWASDL
jgi:hypothetical protein